MIVEHFAFNKRGGINFNTKSNIVYWTIPGLIEYIDYLRDGLCGYSEAHVCDDVCRRHYDIRIDLIPNDGAVSDAIHKTISNIKEIHITELKTNKTTRINISDLVRVDCQMYGHRSDINSVIAISARGVVLIKDLSPIMFNAILDTQRMPKLLWIDKGTTIEEILRIPQLTAWLPNGTTFDLDRQPADKWVTRYSLSNSLDDVPEHCDDTSLHWSVGYLSENRNGCGKFADFTRKDETYYYRWIRYYRSDQWEHDTSWSSYIPNNAAPADGSLILIPMKHECDHGPRDFLDKFLMYVQIRHKNK